MIMRLRSSNGRPGATLTEVLIAIFVLALGLMGVLSLFPLGAVRMAQAIKDDRTAIHNLNVGANLRWVWKDELLFVNAAGASQTRLLYPQRQLLTYPGPTN